MAARWASCCTSSARWWADRAAPIVGVAGMGRVSPPGFVDDFARRPAAQDALGAGWDAIVSELFDAYAGLVGGAFYGPGPTAPRPGRSGQTLGDVLAESASEDIVDDEAVAALAKALRDHLRAFV